MRAENQNALEIEQITKRFGKVTALDSLSLTVHPGEFFALLGPSGCGKTTLLRVVAGLEEADSGKVLIGHEDVTKLPPEKRPVNTVFQSYALFPHLSVFENVAFGLRIRKRPEQEIRDRCKRMMELVEVPDLASRKPAEISGGQKQRVALARALVNEPKVLLLDEPLAAIDLKLRKQLQTSLRQLQRKLGLTFLHVTHDQEEAMLIADRIALMNSGRIEQLGTPEDLYARPRTRFAAQFFGACNIFAVRPTQTAVAETTFGTLHLLGNVQTCLGIRPEHVRLVRNGEPRLENCFPGKVLETRFVGQTREYIIQAGSENIQAIEMNGSSLPPKPDDEVHFQLPAQHLVPLRETPND